ncbi:MAG TPA: hypothetical protein VHG28_10970, partial [Longimicrobiaceae bacterium]|nr:hypothetical protein [Longimicrobiaceae bacterium]
PGGGGGVALGITAAIVYMYIAMAALALRIVGRTWREFLAAQVAGVAVGVVVAIAALSVRMSMESLGYGSGWIFPVVLATCAAALPVGIFLLPDRVRPVDLFSRLGGTLARLPRPLQGAASRILRLAPTVAVP